VSSRALRRGLRACAVTAVAGFLTAACAGTPPADPVRAAPAPPPPAPLRLPEPAPPAVVDPAAAADRELAARVEHALATDPALRDAVIEAEARGGQVTLSGTVPTFREQARAIETALGVPGVMSVRPRLVLQAP